jgi:hypothetical protein
VSATTATRFAAFGVTVACAVGGLSLVGAMHERDALPVAAHQFLQATIEASAVTSCLQGAQDELFLPGGARLRTATATAAALSRLQGCDIDTLAQKLDAVHLPPAAPLTDAARRNARAALVTGVTTLHRVVLDFRGADRAMTANVKGLGDGTAVVLAYRSASAGSDAAYALADKALALLGEPQSTVSG